MDRQTRELTGLPLVDLEAIVERCLDPLEEGIAALLEIRDRELYRPRYTSFPEYLRGRWGRLSRSRVYQRLRFFDVRDDLSTRVDSGTMLPENEKQTRPLAPLEPEVRVAIWCQAVEEAPAGEQPSASRVKELVDRARADPRVLARLGSKSEQAAAVVATEHEILHLGTRETSDQIEARFARFDRALAKLRRITEGFGDQAERALAALRVFESEVDALR